MTGEPPRATGAGQPGAWPFACREHELATVVAALRDGGGAAAFGDPGSGTSRLISEAVAAERHAGPWHVVVASRGAAAVEFGAWAHLLPAGDLARAESWRALVDERGGPDGRLRVVVEDAHWLDDGSAALLHHLVASGQAVAAVTARRGARIPPAVTALWKDGHLQRIDVERFDRPQVEVVLEAALGAPVEPRTVDRLHARSGGSALLLRELVEDARRSGALRSIHGAWVDDGTGRPSARLVDLLAERIDELDPELRSAAEVLAVASPVDVELLARALSPAVVGRLTSAGLVQIDRAGPGRVARAADPLMAEVLVERLDGGRRDAVVGLLVDGFERSAPLAEDDELRLVGWQLDLGRPIDGAAALRVADRAAARSDFAAAERLAGAAAAAGAGPGATIRLGEALVQQRRSLEADRGWHRSVRASRRSTTTSGSATPTPGPWRSARSWAGSTTPSTSSGRRSPPRPTIARAGRSRPTSPSSSPTAAAWRPPAPSPRPASPTSPSTSRRR
ncbi:MAG: hypothetical protein R2702_16265 [Acidimicrobiales bacterium]